MFLQSATDYAIRSLVRHKTRTILTIGTVALSVGVSIVANQYAKAVLKIWEQASIDRGTAHAQFHKSGFFDDPDTLDVRTTFENKDLILKSLGSDPKVEAISPRLLLEGVISARGKTVYFLGRAVDGPSELKVSPKLFAQSGTNGYFVSSDRTERIVLGRGLADSLELKIGDDANLMVSTVHGAVNGIDVVIGGIIDLPIAMLSKRLLYMDLRAAQKAVEMPNRFNEIAIRLKSDVEPRIWTKEKSLDPLLIGQNLDLRGWWEIDKIILKAQNLWDAVVQIVSTLLFITAGLSVLNMVLMLISEQTIEIGTLLALGAKERHIYTLVICQATILGLLGALSGSLFANIVLVAMDSIGVPFESPFGGGVFMVHPKMGLMSTLMAFCSGILVAAVASVIPAVKASKLDPVIAFRGQLT